jgi:crotonobetainyl-CoA:carnitine CoA-transferase CaiB-like acyl-CoA transferase
VLDLKQAFDQDQVRHRRMRWQDPQGNDHIGVPIRFAEEPGKASPDLPRLGEHNRALLGACGYADSELDQLEQDGVLLSEPGA